MFGRTPAALTLHAMNLAFAKIPLGVHTIWACLATSAVLFVLSFLLRLGVSTILPFEVIIVGLLNNKSGLKEDTPKDRVRKTKGDSKLSVTERTNV